MKRVFVSGYVSNNLGDDLFFSLLVKRYPKTCFTFEFGDNSRILRNFENIDNRSYRLKELLANIRHFNAFVLIGGSMFQQVKGKPWFKSWLILFLKVLSFKIFNKKVVFIGFNFGPYHSKMFYVLYKILFSLVDFLSVRDKKTFQLFKHNKNLHLFPDIVFSLDDKNIKQPKKKSLAVSVMDFGPNVEFQAAYENFLVKVINGIDPKISVNLYGFQSSSQIDDGVVIDRIKKKLRGTVGSLCYDGNNIEVFLQDYYKNFFSITSRFHSLVLSLKAKQQIVSINYNIKVESLLDTLDMTNMNVQIDEFDDDRIVQRVIDSVNGAILSDNEYMSGTKLDKTIDHSTEHFKYLDVLLK